MIIQYFID